MMNYKNMIGYYGVYVNMKRVFFIINYICIYLKTYFKDVFMYSFI